MGFCTYSSQIVTENKTQVDNMFIDSFMPNAPADCVKVYLYGLYACGDGDNGRNSLQEFAKVLKMTEDDIYTSFLYWQDLGLVTILQTIPFKVKYLSVKNSFKKLPKFKEGKYTNFNLQIQEIISGRMITPNEFYEYYTFLENFHMESDALVLVAKYCVDIKGNNINYPYILKVAKDFVSENLLTVKDVDEKLQSFATTNEDISLMLKAIGSSRKPTHEERDVFFKWTEMGFDLGTIIFVVKNQKKLNKKLSFNYIDAILNKYYKAQVFVIEDIENYETLKKEYFQTAKDVCKSLGVYYENYEIVVDEYIIPWQNFGYDNETILMLAKNCFKSNIKTLSYMDKQIQKLYKLGVVSKQSFLGYTNEILENEKLILEVLKQLCLERNITSFDRECYKNWTQNWNFDQQMILESAKRSVGKPQSVMYMNKILSNWFENNIKKVEDIKDSIPAIKQQKTEKKNFSKHEFTKEELGAIFTKLEDIEI